MMRLNSHSLRSGLSLSPLLGAVVRGNHHNEITEVVIDLCLASAGVNTAIRAGILPCLCLTHFDGDEARKTILLATAAFRRVYKLFLISSEAQWRMAEALFFLDRYKVPELVWD